MQRNIRKLVIFAGLPLAAIALAVFLLSWGSGSGQKAHATNEGVNFSLSSTVSAGCDTLTTGKATCSVPAKGQFTVAFNLKTRGSVVNYSGYDVAIVWAGSVNYIKGQLKQTGAGVWPDCGNPVGEGVNNSLISGNPTVGPTKTVYANGAIGTACVTSGGNSVYSGTLMTMGFDCKNSGSGTITLVLAVTDITDSAAGTHLEKGTNDQLNINCVPASATPVPTATSTPPSIPFVQKLPVLQNVFLTHQATKLAPATCEAGTNVATLTETLQGPIVSQDPKGAPGTFQKLAAFQFEVRFDDKLVCVAITPGTLFSGPTAVCTSVAAKGLVRFGCVTVGKGAGINGPGALAVVKVRPQPELYSQLRPNQDNGIPVQILNQGCNLSDEQGHVVPISSCEDADITFRYLEGDVVGPNCAVGVSDAQTIAMRWGAAKGSLLYNSFNDLSPSGQIKGDGRIDIKDLQFVFGRLGSTCTAPHPLQPPVNPKA